MAVDYDVSARAKLFCCDRRKLAVIYVFALVLDLALLPKFVFSTPLSIFLLPCALFFLGRLDFSLIIPYLALGVTLLISVIYGELAYGGYTYDNIKRAAQFYIILSLIFLNYRDVDHRLLVRTASRAVFVFYIVALMLLLLFSATPDAYVALIKSVYSEAVPMLMVNMESSRYSFHFTDPNSFGYMLVIILAFLLFCNISLFKSFIYIVVTLILVLSTQSRGAALAFLVVLILFFLDKLNHKNKLFFVMYGLFFVGGAYWLFQESILLSIENYEVRFQAEDAMGAGVGGGRISSWIFFVENFNLNPFFGVGYTLERLGNIYRPHSDFIRLNLSYGWMTYIVMVYLLFRMKVKNIMLLSAFLVPFFINTVIDDYRLFGLFIVFILINQGSQSQKANLVSA